MITIIHLWYYYLWCLKQWIIQMMSCFFETLLSWSNKVVHNGDLNSYKVIQSVMQKLFSTKTSILKSLCVWTKANEKMYWNHTVSQNTILQMSISSQKKVTALNKYHKYIRSDDNQRYFKSLNNLSFWLLSLQVWRTWLGIYKILKIQAKSNYQSTSEKTNKCKFTFQNIRAEHSDHIAKIK